MIMTGLSTKEIELKIDLINATNYEQLLDLVKPVSEPIEQQNIFFDTPDHSLSRRKLALRLRLQGNEAFIALKGARSKAPDGLANRFELEMKISIDIAKVYLDNGFKSDDLPTEMICKLGKEIKDLEFRKYLSFSNRRLMASHSISDADYILEIDKTTFEDDSTDYEIEIELTNENEYESVLLAVKALLDTNKINWNFQSKSKMGRALIKAGLNDH